MVKLSKPPSFSLQRPPGSASAPLPRLRRGSAGRFGGHLLQTHWPRREGWMAPGRCAAAETDGRGGLCGDAWHGLKKAWRKGKIYGKMLVFMGNIKHLGILGKLIRFYPIYDRYSK